MTNLSALSPAEIDTQLAGLHEKLDRNLYYLESERRYLADAQRRGHRTDRHEAEVARYEAKVSDLFEEMKPLNQEFRDRGGWDRYFLVDNSNGHIHSSTACSTCFSSTKFKWLYELADKGERNLVAEFGDLACTVCFPSAPTYTGFGDGKSKFAQLTNAEKAEKARVKAEKAAAKAAKAITAPDGSKLKGYHGTIATLVTAKQELTSALQYVIVPVGNPTFKNEMNVVANRIAEAIAHKTGATKAEVMAEHVAKAEKKNRSGR